MQLMRKSRRNERNSLPNSRMPRLPDGLAGRTRSEPDPDRGTKENFSELRVQLEESLGRNRELSIL